MPSLGNLWYTLGIKDLTDADLKKINAKLKDLGSEIQITPKFVKSLTEILPKEVPIKLNPKLKPLSNEVIEKAVQTNAIKAAQAELNQLKTVQTEVANAAKRGCSKLASSV